MEKRTTKTKITTCSIVILVVSLLIILSTVIAGFCVRFLVEDENLSRLILVGLIAGLIVVGVVSLVIMLVHRRNVKNIVTTRNGRVVSNGAQYHNPTAPPLSGRSSWAYSKNLSARTTMEA